MEDCTSKSKLERLKGNGLRGEKKFAGESGFGGTAVQSLFRRKQGEIGIVVFLRHVS